MNYILSPLEGSLGLKCYVCDKCANGGVGELRTCPEGAQGSCVIEITKSQTPELEGESSRESRLPF